MKGLFRHRPLGRGINFPTSRGYLEVLLRMAYPFDWPRLLSKLAPGTGRVERIDYPMPILPPGSDSLVVGFASDLHFGPVTPPRAQERAFELLAEAAPDVLVLGGDYVFLDATPSRLRDMVRHIRRVPAREKYAVLGNHDLWSDNACIEAALEDAGVRVLVNESVRLAGRDAYLVGIDDPWAGSPDVDKALQDLPEKACKIAVCHSPEVLPKMPRRGVSLLLCGHTHGGQVCLPGNRPLITGGAVGRVHPAGLFHLESFGFDLFVSRGVGRVVLPLRMFAPADVALFRLSSRPHGQTGW